jgi:hypothetical protein
MIGRSDYVHWVVYTVNVISGKFKIIFKLKFFKLNYFNLTYLSHQ